MGVEMEKVVLVTIRHSNTAASEALQGQKQARTVSFLCSASPAQRSAPVALLS